MTEQNLLETTFARLKKHFETRDCAFISACRSENTPEENNIATENLERDLRYLGYGFIKVKGGYIETADDGREIPVVEKTFAVFNNNHQNFKNFPGGYKTHFKRDMIGLCRKYDQNTVLIKEAGQPGHYYDQAGNAFGNFNHISTEDIEEYFTKLRSNTFKFTEAEETVWNGLNMEEYSRYNQTFGTKVMRAMFFADMHKLYSDLFPDKHSTC